MDEQQVAGIETVTASVQTPFDVNEEKSKEERVVAWHGSCGPTEARHSGLSPLVILRRVSYLFRVAPLTAVLAQHMRAVQV